MIDQKWAVPQAGRDALDPTGTNPLFATLDQYGRFETTVTIGSNAALGNYGVYVYPASGAVDAAQELEVPIPVGP